MSFLKNTFGLLENINESANKGATPFQFTYKGKDGKTQEMKVEDSRKKVALVNMMIQSFLLAPQKRTVAGKETSIQAFTGSSSIPTFTDAAFTTFVDERNYDLGWARSFKTVELLEIGMGKKQLHFNIATGEAGGTMVKIPEGGKVQFDGYKADSLTVKIEKYGMGYSVTWEMLNNRDFNAFGEMLENVSAQIYGTWADIHYALLAAAADASASIAYDTTGADTLEKDSNTINNACVALLELNKDKGYGTTGETNFVIHAPETLRARINRALRGLITDERKVVLEYNVQPEYTLNSELLASGGSKVEFVITIPGRKIQNAVHTENLGLTENDIASLNESKTNWTAFGAGIGDNDQCKRVLLHT